MVAVVIVVVRCTWMVYGCQEKKRKRQEDEKMRMKEDVKDARELTTSSQVASERQREKGVWVNA